MRSNTGRAWVKLEEEAGDFFGQKKLNINKHANDTSKISTKPETDKQGHEQLSLEHVENPDPNMKNEDGRNNLECKRKYGEYISKDSVRLSRDGYDAILGGKFDFFYPVMRRWADELAWSKEYLKGQVNGGEMPTPGAGSNRFIDLFVQFFLEFILFSIIALCYNEPGNNRAFLSVWEYVDRNGKFY
ncbi:hypothetical protein [Parablautia intestinalis]|uniref:hypothetical protein n=1 Tax=Parablautia intestinalis TaxID=2320100 RepID=UPI0011C44217|nr:hypothetical protein [Parablautia intestinalis]